MVVLDRFSGGNDPEGWIIRAEQYFTCLGFSHKDWLPLPYFYLDGEALTWFTWLHRNKQFFDWKHFTEKLLMRFPQRTFTASASMEDTSRAYIDYMRYCTFVPPATSASAVVALSHVTNSFDLDDAFTNGNTEADHMLEKLPEKYTNVDSLALLTGSNPEIATLEGLKTPQIGNAKSVEADLVQEPSSIIEDQVFDEISHSTMSTDISELNYSFCENVSLQTKVRTLVLNDPKRSNSAEEENSLDTVALFDKTLKKDASGPLAPFVKQPVMSNTRMQITGMVCPIATAVSLLVPLVGQEATMSNEYLELDMLMRYIVTNSLGSGSPTWQSDLETFTVGMEDLFLDKYLLKNGSVISTSVMHSVGLLLGAEKRKFIGGFNGQHILSQFLFVPAATFLMLIVSVHVTAADLCVWDPGIDFRFMVLKGCIENVEELLLLGCTNNFFLIAYLNPLRRVWDPGQSGCVNSYWFNFSVVDNCSALTRPLIAYSLVFAAYYTVKHDVLVANFQQTSVLHFRYITVLVGMVQVGEVKVLRSVYKVKVVHSAGYTLYGVIEIVQSSACYRLHHALDNALIFVILLNKCAVARQVIPELHLIMSKSFIVNQKERDCNWLISVPMERFGGRRASTTIHRFFKVNISIDRKGVDTKEEWSKNSIATLVSYICRLLLENMTKVPCVVASSAASVSWGEISRYIALLDTSNISKHPCHVIPRLSKNYATMYRLLQATNHIMIAFLHDFACSSRVYCTPSCQMTFPYLNLEDKVLFGDECIVVNQASSIKVCGLEVVNEIGPSKILKSFIWDPGPINIWLKGRMI